MSYWKVALRCGIKFLSNTCLKIIMIYKFRLSVAHLRYGRFLNTSYVDIKSNIR